MELRGQYGYDADKASQESGFVPVGESMAKQSFKEECDINTIVRRFGLGQEMPPAFRAPVYGDFRGIGSYQDALNAVVAAREAFDELPAAMRQRFHFDPAELIAFVSDEKNRPEAEKLGLLAAKAAALAASAPGVVVAPGTGLPVSGAAPGAPVPPVEGVKGV